MSQPWQNKPRQDDKLPELALFISIFALKDEMTQDYKRLTQKETRLMFFNGMSFSF